MICRLPLYLTSFVILLFRKLFVVAIACKFGLQFVRKFALQIANENQDALLAMDQANEDKRVKKERAADAAAASAFAKVQPILTSPVAEAKPALAEVSSV